MTVLKLLPAVLLLTCIGFSQVRSQNLMYYTCDRYKYTIQIPEEWKRKDDLENQHISLVLISPAEASVNVTFYSLKSVNMDQFVTEYVSFAYKTVKNLEILEKGTLKTADGNATYVLTEFDEDLRYREKLCFYSRPNDVAVVTAREKAGVFDESLSVFEKIFASFTFETLQEKVEKDPKNSSKVSD